VYLVHFIETANKITEGYDNVEKQNKREVKMKKEEIHQTPIKTKNDLKHPVNH